MRANFTIICLLVGLAIFVRADKTSSGKLMGAVRDSEGAVIANSIVLVHWDCPGADAPRRTAAGLKQELRLTTGARGEFSVALAQGFYDVAVFAHGFSPVARKVRIRKGQTFVEQVKLSADPQEGAEFGDDFFTEPSQVPLISSPKPK